MKDKTCAGDRIKTSYISRPNGQLFEPPLMLTIMTPYGYYTTPKVRKNRADVGPPRKPDG